ncbi:hypothetical protein [Pseudofulvibacter geojedonensis]|uniref:PD(D/E)XK endonuclease domain-containing protein n=1 Tax=Pseudofulvibacter geojedonensis TaxID=1123758 RepID=A0ABW3I2K8_9FLAO
MTQQEVFFNENILKGRIAETITEQLFTSLGYEVYRYGMETQIPSIMPKLKEIEPNEIIYEIRKTPDFIVLHSKSRKIHYLEVKFRKSGEFDYNSIGGEDYPYKNTMFIIFSKNDIKCISYSELKDGYKVSPETEDYLLENNSEIFTDSHILGVFRKLALKYFKCV